MTAERLLAALGLDVEPPEPVVFVAFDDEPVDNEECDCLPDDCCCPDPVRP